MIFDREPLPRIQFAENPLKVVLVQLRFPTDFRLEQSEVLAEIQARIKGSYPVPSRVQQISVQFALRPNATPSVQHPQASVGSPVRFADVGGAWAATVAPDFVSLETTRYDNWDDFRERFRELLQAILEIVNVSAAQRLGLRFVNELTHPNARTMADWRQLLNPALLGTPGTSPYAELSLRGVEQIAVAEGENGLALRHAYTMNPAGATPPSTFLVDTDVFTVKAMPLNEETVAGRLELYHTVAWNTFREHLGEGMISALGEREAK